MLIKTNHLNQGPEVLKIPEECYKFQQFPFP